MDLATTTRYTAADLARAASPARRLEGGGLTATVTAAGTGVVSFDGADLTRWRGDRTADADGLRVVLRDLDADRVWTVGFDPEAAGYEARFG
ncbi:MAG: hypothetical protein AAGJ11_04185, partial [Bacteroidota bacterium]